MSVDTKFTVVLPLTDQSVPPNNLVAGTAYTADVFAVDASGNGAPSASQSWTQTAAATAPAAPTGFTVS